jgi:nitrogen regulatory protein PII
VQKIKLEMVVKDEQVGPIIQIVMDLARTGHPGDGRIYVYDVCEVVRIRTGERGIDAL